MTSIKDGLHSNTKILHSIPSSWRALDEKFFARSAPLVAEELLGVLLLRRWKDMWIGGPIVETEAYTDDDPASHSFKGERPHNASMFGPPGMVYVYRSYGVHWCLNFSTGKKGQGEAVLIRAIAATFGNSEMKLGASAVPAKICSGPGRLCAALHIDKAHNGGHIGSENEISLWQSTVERDYELAVGQRIGISKALDRHWRFGISKHPSLSRAFPKI